MQREREITVLTIIKQRKALGSAVNHKQNESPTWYYCKKEGGKKSKFIMAVIMEVLDRG